MWPVLIYIIQCCCFVLENKISCLYRNLYIQYLSKIDCEKRLKLDINPGSCNWSWMIIVLQEVHFFSISIDEEVEEKKIGKNDLIKVAVRVIRTPTWPMLISSYYLTSLLWRELNALLIDESFSHKSSQFTSKYHYHLKTFNFVLISVINSREFWWVHKKNYCSESAWIDLANENW